MGLQVVALPPAAEQGEDQIVGIFRGDAILHRNAQVVQPALTFLGRLNWPAGKGRYRGPCRSVKLDTRRGLNGFVFVVRELALALQHQGEEILRAVLSEQAVNRCVELHKILFTGPESPAGLLAAGPLKVSLG